MALGQRRRVGVGATNGNEDDHENQNGNSHSSSFTPQQRGQPSQQPYNHQNNAASPWKLRWMIFLVLVMMSAVTLVQERNNSNTFATQDLHNRALSFSRYYANSGGGADNSNDCTIPRFKMNSKDAKGLGSRGPVLLEGWESRPSDWSIPALMDRVGDLPQYIKDLTVQPLKKTQSTTSGGNKKSFLKNANKQQDELSDYCIVTGRDVVNLLPDHDLLFFTNNKENEPFMKELSKDYKAPKIVRHINSFQVFSAMNQDKYHSFHAYGESWLGQVEGRRMWWFLPPTAPKPERVNACHYLTGQAELPPNAMSCIQNPGEIIWFPKDWYRATCALDAWVVGIGAQSGRTIRQEFPKLNPKLKFTAEQTQATLKECLGIEPPPPQTPPVKPQDTSRKQVETAKKDDGDGKWKWFDGDLNAYYNSLEKDIDRDPTTISSYAVHRWMGPKRSTEEHYELINQSIEKHMGQDRNLRVFDGGCGLGSALMWMEGKHADWDLTGHTISEEQYAFIQNKLPAHKFHVNLQSYDDIDGDLKYDVFYSIEALIHSLNVTKTMQEWATHLTPGGIIVIIDDYINEGVDKTHEDIQSFAKSWLANVLITPSEFEALGQTFGLSVIENRDLVQEYDIVKLNYRNQKPNIAPFGGRTHQGWMGSKWRQRLTVEGRVGYRLMVLQKPKEQEELVAPRQLTMTTAPNDNTECDAVPFRNGRAMAEFTEMTPQLMSGRGNNGGKPMACISGWYCCNKGLEWFDHLDAHRTDNTASLKLDRSLFGHYIDVFAKHLNEHYATYPQGVEGRFLDIGGTGSTASGMQKVTSKFQHFAGPLEYWKLDSDPAAKDLERTLYCDIDDCPAADDCGFDVTFSHTVLEHAKRPWKSFDTIARITKKGGLTMHLVPWSYQYHATPDDNYRFSHKALITLLEDRDFDVLEVGYDICTKPENMKNRVDEHYDIIWLTYVVGRKR